MLNRLPKLLDPDEFEAALTAAVAVMALDPAIPAAYAAHCEQQRREQGERQKSRKPPAAAAFREEREDGWFRPHPWLDPAACGDPGHVPARHGVAVDGKERKGAKKGGNKKMHLLAAVTHVPGIVIAQDRIAQAGKANEISHFKPLLAPLPLAGAVVTSDQLCRCRHYRALGYSSDRTKLSSRGCVPARGRRALPEVQRGVPVVVQDRRRLP